MGFTQTPLLDLDVIMDIRNQSPQIVQYQISIQEPGVNQQHQHVKVTIFNNKILSLKAA